MNEKTMVRILQEEREKLLAEVKEKVKRKKLLMNSDDPEIGFGNFKRK
jgi:hypothetical protein